MIVQNPASVLDTIIINALITLLTLSSSGAKYKLYFIGNGAYLYRQIIPSHKKSITFVIIVMFAKCAIKEIVLMKYIMNTFINFLLVIIISISTNFP